MKYASLGKLYLTELENEMKATRKCLERIPESLFHYKPHETSMAMGDLALIVAEIPKWVMFIADGTDIDLATWEQFHPKNTAELVKYFDDNMKGAEKALNKISDEEMDQPFQLKNKGQVLMTSPAEDAISSAVNHMVHHRGQLTVYMRLNKIPVPSIYGPSADEKTF